MADGSRQRLWLAVGLIVIAFNLRPAIAAISPLLPVIRRAEGLSAPVAGLLTTVPLLCFGLGSPVVPRLVRRTGVGRALLYSLIGVTAGIAVRSLPSVGTLFLGTLMLGCSLAIANVLMPGIVKSRFFHRTGLVTGLYTTMVDLGISISAGITVPLTHLLGGSWRLAIGLWAISALIAVGLWGRWRNLDRQVDLAGPEAQAREPLRVWRNPTAWWITSFMGLQSLSFFTVLAWLPTMLQDRGSSAAAAGAVLSFTNAVAIPAAFIAPVIAHRMKDQRIAAVGTAVAMGIGLLGFLVDPRHLDFLWAAALGVGQGSSLSIALMMIVMRSDDSSHAVALSGMAQGVGYLVASTGPAVIGAIYGATGGWSVPLSILVVIAGAQGVAGWVAGHAKPPAARRESGAIAVG